MKSRGERIVQHIEKHPERSSRELARQFRAEDSGFREFVKELFELQGSGKILRLPRQGWDIPQRTAYRVGELSLERRGNSGFVRVAPGDLSEDDLYVREKNMRDAFPGDLVLLRIERPARRGRLREGTVVEVVQRTRHLVRGRFWKAAEAGLVSPTRGSRELDIHIDERDSSQAADGEHVLVKLLDKPPFGIHPRGKVTARVTAGDAYSADFQVICAEYELPTSFPADVLQRAERIASITDGAPWDDRVDLRSDCVFTIDPVDAKDFDDAISVEPRSGGALRLSVHIADVAHYVKPGSALDRTAARRATSVYLPGTVLPMLPERLSNDLCSLRPDEDRLAKTVRLTFDGAGRVGKTEIFNSVIRSCRRFTYEEVQAILEFEESGRATGNLPPDHGEFGTILTAMSRLRDKLHKRRYRRGSLYLDIPKLSLVLDDSLNTTGLGREERDPSHSLVEEFMLEANEAVARYCQEKSLPLVARVHRPPDDEKLENFRQLLDVLGFRLGGKGGSKEIQRLVRDVSKEPLSPLIQLGLLRTMGHAEYVVGAGLHFALATSSYCHFTSPIRRYPDLLVHQILEEHLTARGGRGINAKRRRELKDHLAGEVERCSARERRAEEAERDMQRLRLIRYLAPRVGEEFDAVITSVHAFGFFIRVETMLVEGLVHVATLQDDYYEFEATKLELRGRRRRRRFAVGDRVRVELVDVDPAMREISFRLVKKLPG